MNRENQEGQEKPGAPAAASPPLKTTPLNAAHRAAGARLVDFGGWEMPLHYGSQIEEHHAVRRGCGMFDVSHMCALDLTGPDASAFLRRLLANDVARLSAPGKALYAAMLNDAGGVIDDLIVYCLGEAGYRLVLNAGTAPSDLAWMEEKRREWALTLELNERQSGADGLAMLAVQGPQAKEITWRALPQLREASAGLPPFCSAVSGDFFIATTGYTGEDGFEIALPASAAGAVWEKLRQAGAAPCGLGARDTLRLEAGMNLYGNDMDQTTSPLDCGLGWTVDLQSERDFVGKAALLSRGQSVQQLGLLLEGRGVLRSGQPVFSGHGAGVITSGSFSPSIERAIALARLPLAVQPGAALEVEIRGRREPVRVVKPPFVRRGKVLV